MNLRNFLLDKLLLKIGYCFFMGYTNENFMLKFKNKLNFQNHIQ